MRNLNIKLYFKKRKQRLSVFGVSLVFDWRIILGVAGIVLIVGIVYSSLLYMRVTNGSLFETVENQDSRIEIEQKRAVIDKKVEELDQKFFDETTIN